MDLTVEVVREEPQTEWDSVGPEKLVARFQGDVLFEFYSPDAVNAPEDVTFDRDLSALPGLFQKVFETGRLYGKVQAIEEANELMRGV